MFFFKHDTIKSRLLQNPSSGRQIHVTLLFWRPPDKLSFVLPTGFRTFYMYFVSFLYVLFFSFLFLLFRFFSHYFIFVFCVSFFSFFFRYFSHCFLFVFFPFVSFRFSLSQFTGTLYPALKNKTIMCVDFGKEGLRPSP